ncbi:MAG: sigma-70 family RNA polymerase sigma factor [Planctomycetes bacterium]|nr:sigma-70 family RNA polymerase sigma factor [Planctomycetota bacterium]
MSSKPNAITLCLQRLRDGDAAAANDMLPLVYDELRGLAAHLMRGDRRDHTLQATALVHEAWLKIANAIDGGSDVRDRHHFLAVAATAMRQVLINHARERRAQKRGADAARIVLDDCVDAFEAQTGDLVELNDVLDRLASEHPRSARIVEMRVFGGMLVEEVARALDLAESTVKADWRFARAWLQRALPRGGPPGDP